MSNSIRTNILPKFFVLTIIFAGFLALTASSALAFSGTGNGTSTPYQITTIEQLQEIDNELDANYELMNDLDFCDASDYESSTTTPGITDYCESEGATEGWDMIAPEQGSHFTGVFDGGEHVIRNLYINDSTDSQEHFGFFSSMQDGAVVKNIGFEDANVISSNSSGDLIDTGIIAGVIHYYAGVSVISNSYTTGSVKHATTSPSSNMSVGGLIGVINYETEIKNSYSDAAVSGPTHVGGLVGQTGGAKVVTVTDSYSSGPVTATENSNGDSTINGVIGKTDQNSFDAAFWDTQASLQAAGSDAGSSGGLFGETTPKMFSFDTFSNDWDIAKVANYSTTTDETWKINDGQDYPRLGWESNDIQHGGYTLIEPAEKVINEGDDLTFTAEAYDASGNLITDTTSDFSWSGGATDGEITNIDAGENSIVATHTGGNIAAAAHITAAGVISSIEDLREIGSSESKLAATYRLTTDLDFCDPNSYESPDTGTTSVSNYCNDDSATTTGWGMLGNLGGSYAFTGVLDGQEHVIKNLYVNQTGNWGNGLIQHTNKNAVIKNLGVVDADINDTGNGGAAGILIGSDQGYSEGGAGYTVTIDNVFTTGSVYTDEYGYAGGIIGAGGDVDINNSYSTADVTADEIGSYPRAAGLYGGFWAGQDYNGEEYSSFTNSYAAGSISGSPVDGLVVDESYGLQSDSYQNNFFDVDVGGEATTSAFATGKTTAEMQSLSTFTDTSTDGLDSSWDIATPENHTDETWVIDEGSTYPELSWYFFRDYTPPASNASSGSGSSLAPGGMSSGGPSDSDDEDEKEEEEAEDTDEEEAKEDKKEKEEPEEKEDQNLGERVSRLAKDVADFQQDTDMDQGERLSRFRDILVELVDILSNS